jgi:hypothetical protein
MVIVLFQSAKTIYLEAQLYCTKIGNDSRRATIVDKE